MIESLMQARVLVLKHPVIGMEYFTVFVSKSDLAITTHDFTSQSAVQSRETVNSSASQGLRSSFSVLRSALPFRML